jgi:cell division septation protein DedD
MPVGSNDPAIAPPAAAATASSPAKPILKKVAAADKPLGSKPVMLVAPASPVAAVARTLQPASANATATAALQPPQVDTSGGLYGDTPLASAPPAKPPTAPVQAAVVNSGYKIQLASFASKSEATAEYQRLAVKHGAIITQYAPLIEQADVAGSSRYRLNLGPMATIDVAQNVCASLIAAGERDCLVRR